MQVSNKIVILILRESSADEYLKALRRYKVIAGLFLLI